MFNKRLWQNQGLSREPGGLVTLNLANNSLVGEIPESLGQLAQLSTLSLEGHSELSGELPDGFQKLTTCGVSSSICIKAGSNVTNACSSALKVCYTTVTLHLIKVVSSTGLGAILYVVLASNSIAVIGVVTFVMI
jgi:hypothetical protein